MSEKKRGPKGWAWFDWADRPGGFWARVESIESFVPQDKPAPTCVIEFVSGEQVEVIGSEDAILTTIYEASR